MKNIEWIYVNEKYVAYISERYKPMICNMWTGGTFAVQGATFLGCGIQRNINSKEFLKLLSIKNKNDCLLNIKDDSVVIRWHCEHVLKGN